MVEPFENLKPHVGTPTIEELPDTPMGSLDSTTLLREAIIISASLSLLLFSSGLCFFPLLVQNLTSTLDLVSKVRSRVHRRHDGAHASLRANRSLARRLPHLEGFGRSLAR